MIKLLVILLIIKLYARNNLPRIKDGAYAINLDDKIKEQIGFHYLLTETRMHTFTQS